jgi:flagellar biosynthesis protein
VTRPADRPKRSVALAYDRGVEPAPRVAAKGEGAQSDLILRLAREYGIPVENDPLLADALFRFPEGDPIPPELYLAVAEVYAFLIRTRRMAVGEAAPEKSSAPPSPGE